MTASRRDDATSPTGAKSDRNFWSATRERLAERIGAARMPTAVLWGLLLLLQVAAGVLTPIGVSLGSWWDYVHMAIMGAILAPPTLLALWAVFGPQRLAVRLPLTLWLTTICYLAMAYGEKRNNGEATIGLDLGGAWLLAFLITQLPLWALRAIRRWRLIYAGTVSEKTSLNVVDRDRAISLRSSQFTLRALLGWTLAAAASLAALRCLSSAADFEVTEIPALVAEAGVIGPLVALAGLPIVSLAWIILADGRRLALRAVLSLLTLVGIPIGLAIFARLEDLETAEALAVCEAGTVLDGIIALGVVRACGYKLHRRSRHTKTAVLPAPTYHRPLSRRRWALAAAPMLAAAAVLACSFPERCEIWRQADVAARWRELGVHIAFDDAGHIISADCRARSLSDAELSRIIGLADLESLDLVETSIDDRQLALLTPLTQLRSLSLGHTRVSDAAFVHLTRFSNLEFLDLTSTAVTDVGVKQLKPLSKLRALHANFTDISDGALATLAVMPQLAIIEAKFTDVTPEGAASLARTCPALQLTFGASDTELARSLSVQRTITVTTAGGRAVGIAREPFKLKRLHAQGKFFVNGIRHTVTDAGLAALAEQTDLEDLDLSESGVTDQGLAALSKLKSLKRLDVRGTAVTEQGAARLVQALPDCRVLR